MAIEVFTKDDLQQFKQELKQELMSEITPLLRESMASHENQWLKGSELRKMFGISESKLRYMRSNSILPFSRIGTTIYYPYQDILQILRHNKQNIVNRNEQPPVS